MRRVGGTFGAANARPGLSSHHLTGSGKSIDGIEMPS